jgi:uncharacterized RDD family membrane protein YckC
VPLDDQVTIATPEGLDVDLVLAGLGSRFVARLIDSVVQLIAIVALLLVAALLSNDGWVLAVMFVLYFLVVFAYDIVFEVIGSGRTLGKRVAGLRVVRSGGQPVGFVASLIRNGLRLLDFLPTAYLLGAILIVVSRRNQRFGDLAAGTLVVRERAAVPDAQGWASWSRPTVPADAVVGWDVSAVTLEEIAAIRTFLDRRLTLPPDARANLAWQLATRVSTTVTGIPASAHAEYVLEGIVVAKEHRR